MDYIKLIINVVAILAGLGVYIGVTNSKWGKEHEQYQYAIMLGSIMFVVLVGGVLKWLL